MLTYCCCTDSTAESTDGLHHCAELHRTFAFLPVLCCALSVLYSTYLVLGSKYHPCASTNLINDSKTTQGALCRGQRNTEWGWRVGLETLCHCCCPVCTLSTLGTAITRTNHYRISIIMHACFLVEEMASVSTTTILLKIENLTENIRASLIIIPWFPPTITCSCCVVPRTAGISQSQIYSRCTSSRVCPAFSFISLLVAITDDPVAIVVVATTDDPVAIAVVVLAVLLIS